MKIAIDRNVPIPAYKQVVDGIAGAIARGDVSRGTRLPSVRNLAVDLGLNVNTVARAYRDLERAGVIDTMPGMGTFVANEVPDQASWMDRRAVARPGATAHRFPPAGASPTGLAAGAPLATSWRDLLAASHALASADGVSEEEFLACAGDAARAARESATFVVAGISPMESADLLRALPTEVAAVSVALSASQVGEAARPGLSAILTTFPAQARVRAALGTGPPVPVIPVETELTEATVRALSELPPSGRLSLVTMEKEHWDQEANDVMKIVGRSRWLKMILLDGGERGLGDRLENVDCILFVPRARRAVEPFDAPGRTLVELARQVTPRARERLHQAVAGRD